MRTKLLALFIGWTLLLANHTRKPAGSVLV